MSNSAADDRFGPVSSPPDPLLTVRQLARREGLSERAVRSMIERHGLPAYRAGHERRGGMRGSGIKIRLSEYLAWLEARRLR
jgi:excisionase family DNA binding protein